MASKKSKVEKAMIINEDTGKQIKVMFNPTEYSYTTTMDMADDESEEGTKAGERYFLQVSKDEFEVTLLLDTYEKWDSVYTKKTKSRDKLLKKIEKIEKLQLPTVSAGKRKRPPICKFKWNKFEYRGIIESLQRDYKMFLPSGEPVRAELTLKFSPILTAKEEKEFSAEGCTRIWTVKSGERLDLIAYHAYGDSTLWPLIAENNNIDKPMKFPSLDDLGKELIIPDL